jgi:hypothetical protein
MKMKRITFFFVAVVMGLFLASCGSAPKPTNVDFVGVEEPLGKTREELKILYGIEVPANGGIVPNFPNVGDVGGISFDKDGKVTRVELPFPRNDFDKLVKNTTEKFGEPTQRGADLVLWEIKPGIYAFVQRHSGSSVAGAAYGERRN